MRWGASDLTAGLKFSDVKPSAHGAEDRVTDTVEAVTGRRPKTFAAFPLETGPRWKL